MTAEIVAHPGAVFFTTISQAIARSALRVRECASALKHRRELRHLLESEDHRLADIGIDRDDLRAGLSEPLWRDPTAALAHRIGRSRVSERQPPSIFPVRPTAQRSKS